MQDQHLLQSFSFHLGCCYLLSLTVCVNVGNGRQVKLVDDRTGAESLWAKQKFGRAWTWLVITQRFSNERNFSHSSSCFLLLHPQQCLASWCLGSKVSTCKWDCTRKPALLFSSWPPFPCPPLTSSREESLNLTKSECSGTILKI